MQQSNPSLSPLQVSQVLSLVASFRRHASDFGVAACYGPQLLEESGACASWSFHKDLTDYSNSFCPTRGRACAEAQSVGTRSSFSWDAWEINYFP